MAADLDAALDPASCLTPANRARLQSALGTDLTPMLAEHFTKAELDLVYGSKVAAMEETGITEARWDHVCVAVASLDDGVLPYIERDLCGRGTFIREFRRPGFFSGINLKLGGGKLEVLEPHLETSFLVRHLAARGPSIHHCTFLVPDLREAAERAEELGYTVLSYSEDFPTWHEFFLHPKQVHGVVIQLAKSFASTGRPVRGIFKTHGSAERHEDPVTLRGVTLSIPDRADADRLFLDLLSATVVFENEEEVHYGWPKSFMVMKVVHGRQEGPVCLNVTTESRGGKGIGQCAEFGAFVNDETALFARAADDRASDAARLELAAKGKLQASL